MPNYFPFIFVFQKYFAGWTPKILCGVETYGRPWLTICTYSHYQHEDKMHKPEYYLTDVALIYKSYCKTNAMCLSFLTNWYLYNQSINQSSSSSLSNPDPALSKIAFTNASPALNAPMFFPSSLPSPTFATIFNLPSPVTTNPAQATFVNRT